MKKINLGIVGYGGIAKIHMIAMNAMKIMFEDMPYSPDYTAVATSQKDIEYPVFDNTVSDLSELLKDSSIAAIDVCTPNFLHFQQGKSIIEAGKHIYMEKPVAKDLHEAQELARLAEASGLVNQSALMYRFLPAIVIAKDHIAVGAIGEVLHFRFVLYHSGYLDASRPMSWRLSHEKSGGGALVDLGIHMADSLRFILGEVDSLMAQTNIHFKERFKDSKKTEKVPSEVDEWAMLHLNMKSGAKGTLEVSRITADLKEDTIIEIFGTKGSLKITSDDVDNPSIYSHEKGLLEKGKFERISDFAKYHKTIYPSNKFDLGWAVNAHLASLKNFLNNVDAGRIVYKETPDFTEASKSQKIIEMAYQSVADGNSWILNRE
ncbi:MAG: Gfo/Idh/MocA family oxidoreductase [Eubacteriaceae bacterium]|nr:Gfo/Idh/MocA family oxidoreductase [Eubacteriaceae bacterium]